MAALGGKRTFARRLPIQNIRRREAESGQGQLLKGDPSPSTLANLEAPLCARGCCIGGNSSATAVPRGRYKHVLPIGDGQSGDIADEAENGCQGPFLVEGENQCADDDNQCQRNGNGTA